LRVAGMGILLLFTRSPPSSPIVAAGWASTLTCRVAGSR
jgi:hypothetical protein